MKILKRGQTGFGVLIENDAGFIDPRHNKEFISELNTIGRGDKLIDPTKPIACVLQKHSVENKNGRIYPEHILKREDNNYQSLIATGSAAGELNHPNSAELDGDRISHLITKTWWESKTMCGELMLMLSDAFIAGRGVFTKGDLVATYLKRGMRIGISSRGVGSIKNIKGQNVVQEDFEIICWDIVLQPSTPNAWFGADKGEIMTYVESKQQENTPVSKQIRELIKGW